MQYEKLELHFWSATLQVTTDTVKQQLVEQQPAPRPCQSPDSLFLSLQCRGYSEALSCSDMDVSKQNYITPPQPPLCWISQSRVGLRIGGLLDCLNIIDLKSNPHTNSTRSYLNFTLFILQNFHSCSLVCPCIYFVYHGTVISCLLHAGYKGNPYLHIVLNSLLMEKLTTVP